MWPFRRKLKPPTLSRDQLLESKAAVNRSMKATRDDKGIVTVSVPMPPIQLPRFLAKRLPADGGDRKIYLDEIGSFVWDMCDGETTVRQMIQTLAERYKVNRKEAEVALTQYLRTLAGKGLIAILVPK